MAEKRKADSLATGFEWSKLHERCLSCGTTEKRHLGHGLCSTCYERFRRSKVPQPKIAPVRGVATREITPDVLRKLYLVQKLSPAEIAQVYGCSRQYVWKLLKKYDIYVRTLSESRRLAQIRGKVVQSRLQANGTRRKVVARDGSPKPRFFKDHSIEMAYVLGTLFSDGNLFERQHRFSLTQKEPELVEKTAKLMGSNARIGFTPARGVSGPVYHWRISSLEVYQDLLRLGLHPKKSHSIRFPDLPKNCVRHFIRGYWDGDGSVSFKNRRCRASVISGSRPFIEDLLRHLYEQGMPIRTVHKHKSAQAYYFYFHGLKQCAKLYHILYDGVPETMYLNRKHDGFKALADYLETGQMPLIDL